MFTSLATCSAVQERWLSTGSMDKRRWHRNWLPVLSQIRCQQQISAMSMFTNTCVERARSNPRAQPWTFRGTSFWKKPYSHAMPGVVWTLARGCCGDTRRWSWSPDHLGLDPWHLPPSSDIGASLWLTLSDATKDNSSENLLKYSYTN